MSGTGSVLAEIIGDGPRRYSEPPAAGQMAAILAAAVQHHASPALKIRRHAAEDGPAYWRWDCARCGEYGGGRHHTDAISRAMRHCAEHPQHRSSLLPPMRCREAAVLQPAPDHPMLFAVDDDPPPEPLST